MRLASFDGNRIGVIDANAVIDVTEQLGPIGTGSWPPLRMVQLIAQFARFRPLLQSPPLQCPRLPLESVRLETPIAWPNKIVAFPANYQAHRQEMERAGRQISHSSADGQGFFLKSNSSLSGPSDPIVLPDIPNREVQHECELAVIIGKAGRQIPPSAAMSHVFGYSCLVDVVVRGKEERVMRKSFDSFCR